MALFEVQNGGGGIYAPQLLDPGFACSRVWVGATPTLAQPP
jgi:hypothetical protein